MQIGHTSWNQEVGPIGSKRTNEEPKLENNVVSRHGVLGGSYGCGIVRTDHKNGEVERFDRLKK